MDLTVSRPVKILALILVIAGVGGVASLSMMGKSSPSSSGTQLSVAQIRARAHGSVVNQKATTPARATHASPTTHATRKQSASKPKPKAAPALPDNGLPMLLNEALRAHRIVVVSVFDPQSHTDAISYAEARAGAGDISAAGFLGVSVLDDSVAGPLTAALPGGGLLPVPGVLIYRRPGTLIERVDGFADRESIAQLALASLTAKPYAPPVAAPPVVAAAPVVAAPTDTTTTTP